MNISICSTLKLRRESWPALVAVMQKVVEIGMNGTATANQKERAKEAEALQGLIFNIRFVIMLSYLTDVYNTFGFGVNCLQVVNMLPFVKMDKFKTGVLVRYQDMIDTIDTDKCPCRNYVKKEGKVFKIIEEFVPSEEDSNNNEEYEDGIMQVDGFDDSSDEEVYDLADSDAEDDSRTNLFSTQQYLDTMSDTTSVSAFPDPATTQDYLDAMSDSAAPSVLSNMDEATATEILIDADGDTHEDNNGNMAKPVGIRYVKADVTVKEGRRVFTVIDKKETQLEYCLFPNAHQDLREIRELGSYRGLPVGSLLPAPVHSGTRIGRRQGQINVLLNKESIIKDVEVKITNLMKHLKDKLSAKVFTPRTSTMIEHTRTILDMQTLIRKLAARSPSDLANMNYQSYRNASIVVEPNLFIDVVEEGEFRVQFREFLKKLKVWMEENPKLAKLDSLGIISKLFEGTEFFNNIEAIMAVMARAMVIIGIESVVESWVSVMESHDSKNRPLGEEMILTETSVSLNGPNPVNCDSVVEEAMRLYWSKCQLKNSSDGHFIRKSSNGISWKVSKAVDTVNKVTPKLPFML